MRIVLSQLKDYVPSKRQTRSQSKSAVPIRKKCSTAKRLTRIRSESAAKRKHTKDDDDDENTIPRLIALNCKLTTEVLSFKKQLSDKNDALFKIQADCFEKQLEVVNLKNSLSDKNKKLEELEKEIRDLTSQMFCGDLIDFEASVENTADVSVEKDSMEANTAETSIEKGAEFEWTPIRTE